MATTAVVTVDDRVFVTMVSTGGEANKYVNRRLDAMKSAAMARAPIGAPRAVEGHLPGTLKRSHFRNGVIWRGRGIRAEGKLINSADYARWVHEGTRGSIHPHGAAFKIPADSWNYYTRMGARPDKTGRVWWNRPVRGQRAQPWMQQAVDLVMASS